MIGIARRELLHARMSTGDKILSSFRGAVIAVAKAVKYKFD